MIKFITSSKFRFYYVNWFYIHNALVNETCPKHFFAKDGVIRYANYTFIVHFDWQVLFKRYILFLNVLLDKYKILHSALVTGVIVQSISRIPSLLNPLCVGLFNKNSHKVGPIVIYYHVKSICG